MTQPRIFRFGSFEFDADSGDLRHDGATTRLRRQPAALLTALLEREGRMLSRAELTALLWPGDVHVDTDAGINFVTRQLRMALGDHATAPIYFETLPRRGYRWLAPIVRDGTVPIAKKLTDRSVARRTWLMAAGLTAAIAILVWAAAPRPAPPRLLVQFGTDPGGARHFDREGLRDMVVSALNRPGRAFDVVAPQLADAYLYRPFPEVRMELSLDLLLHVSIRDANGQPRLHAKLVRAADGKLLWSENRDFAVDALRVDGRAVADGIATHVRESLTDRDAIAVDETRADW
jgi:DNA-binding winged helix-turn-helix (wHTH) protein/TolB-like protein